jgi:hypothetical protein
MIPPKVFELCHRQHTLTAELAKTPSEAPSSVCKRLFGVDTEDDVVEDKAAKTSPDVASDIAQARQCGNWGSSQPSELFLKVREELAANRTWQLISH